MKPTRIATATLLTSLLLIASLPERRLAGRAETTGFPASSATTKYSYLHDPGHRSDSWDRLKYLPFGNGEHYVYLGRRGHGPLRCLRPCALGAGPQDNNGYLLRGT